MQRVNKNYLFKIIVQYSRVLDNAGAKFSAVPVCICHINPIENVFNLVEPEFQHQAIQNGITYETYEQFAEIV